MKLCNFFLCNKVFPIDEKKIDGVKWWLLVVHDFDLTWFLITLWFLRLQDIFFNFQMIFAWTFPIV